MRSSQNPQEDKPWDAVIKKIDGALLDFNLVFDSSFAESQTEVQPRELLKRGLFRHIWKKLSVDAPVFASLDDLDSYYQQVARNFQRHVGDYLRLEKVKMICDTYQLHDPVSARKLEMLKKIIRLYHALARSRFLLQGLSEGYSVDKCADKVLSVQVQTQVNHEQLAKIDVNLYQKRSVNAIKSFNQYLLKLMYENGYGEVEIDGLLLPDETEKMKDSAFVALYAKLQELPKVSEMMDLLDGKLFDSKVMRAEKLAQHINTIQTVRLLLRKICNEVFIASSRNVETLAEDYEALQAIKSKIKGEKELDVLSRKLFDLSNAVEGVAAPESSVPVLRAIAREVLEETGRQSQAEMITRISINGWGVASACVKDEVVNIIKSTRDVSARYQQHIDAYHAAIESSQQQKELFTKAERLILEWRVVNQQMQQVLEQCDLLLDAVETKVVTEAQTTLQFVGSFFKHHWPKMVIGAAVLAVPAAAVSLTVMSAASAAVMIPASVVAGTASGAGVGIIADNKHPRAVSAPTLRRPNVNVAGVNSDFIIDKLFAPAHAGAKPSPFIIGGSVEPSSAASPPSPILDVPMMPASRDEIVTQDDAAEDFKMPKWMASVTHLPSQLTEQLGQVPGHLAQVPGQLAQVPGQLVHLPGQLVGLFARTNQPEQQAGEKVPATDVVSKLK